MIIKEILSLDDQVDTAMLTYAHTGLLNKRIRRHKIFSGVFFCIAVSQIGAAFYFSMSTGFKCFTVAITIWFLYMLIFSRKICTRHVKKWTKKNLKEICIKYNVPQDDLEVITEIKDDYIESLVLETKAIYGRFLYFKKTVFKSEEDFSAVLHEITGKSLAEAQASPI